MANEDPNKMLETIRERVKLGRRQGNFWNAQKVLEEVALLDEWLTAGKRFPDAWLEARKDDHLTAEQAVMKRVLKGTRAAYSDDSFYGLLHEVAHMLDLDLPSGDFPTINIALEKLNSIERMTAEVVAHAAARRFCAELKFPVFEDSVRYSAKSTLNFAKARGETPIWDETTFIAANNALERGERVNLILLKFRVMLGERKLSEMGGGR